MSTVRQPASEAPVTVEELHDRAAIAALSPAWEALRAEVATARGPRGPFFAPAWTAVKAAHLAPEALRLLVAHRAGRLAAILPLFLEKRRLSGVPTRILRSLSDDHSQRFDVLMRPDDHATARALVSHLRRSSDWDALELRDAPVEHAAADALCAVAEAQGHLIGRWPSMISPTLPLPSSLDALDQQLSSKFKSNLRRRLKKLEKEVGAVVLERVPNDCDRATLDRALADGFALEAAGWKGEAGTAIACDPALSARYTQLARVFAAQDQLALSFLTVGGVRKAFHYALIDDGIYYLFKPGYDPALASYGLGHLLIDAIIRDLVPRGVRELDFLGDDMPWKREWTDQVRPHAWRYVFARTPFGRALHAWKFSLAPTIKRMLRR
jgi:CelD/BcsL family acetyltransferase involved in cellulose biosynthesis